MYRAGCVGVPAWAYGENNFKKGLGIVAGALAQGS